MITRQVQSRPSEVFVSLRATRDCCCEAEHLFMYFKCKVYEQKTIHFFCRRKGRKCAGLHVWLNGTTSSEFLL